MKKMKENNIETLIHYPFTLSSLCKERYIEKYSVAEFISNNIVSIPFHPWLSDEEIRYIFEKTFECFGDN